jgi:hypothetical protein
MSDELTIQPEQINLDVVEEYMLTLPQMDCPVEHHFSPGVCIRERLMPAGAFILGHKHRYPNMNMIVSGRCVVYMDGQMQEIVAPYMFVGEPCRKVIFAIDDTVWLNVFHTDLTDIAEIENHFIDKSPAYREMEDKRRLAT